MLSESKFKKFFFKFKSPLSLKVKLLVLFFRQYLYSTLDKETKKQINKETKKQRNKKTKKQRNKETKKQRYKETKKQRYKKQRWRSHLLEYFFEVFKEALDDLC